MLSITPHDTRYAGTIAASLRGRLITLVILLLAALIAAVLIAGLSQG
ncbi:hypothetical protein [Aeropyrum pernix]|nr:hypothetical protein [Aeropyrum pernix]